MKVYCDNKVCAHTADQECTLQIMYYANRICKSFRKRNDTKQLMAAPFHPRCRRSGGRYKSNYNAVVK
jgi:hypothetical protein